MKNLKKVLALVVVFTMVLSSVAFASYPDVDATADYAGAVELLSALSILKGDDTGNFNPDQNITRAEFAAVVCRALDLEGSAKGAEGATDFTDVAADHWASGYINLASQQKIINGMGDGTFAPEDNVTYTQAVKMLVVALGYEPMAEKKGGYPTGYLATANSIGLTEGVPSTANDTPALRSTVAMLTANAMELPTMEQHTYGTDSLFGVNDGKKDGYAFKSLLTAMDIYIATGVVDSIDEEARLTAEMTISEDSADGMFEKDDEETIYVNGSDIANYVNQNVSVYVEVKNSKAYVVAIVPSDIGSTTEIDMSLINADSLAASVAKGYVEYYQTADSLKESKIYINDVDTVDVKVNNGDATQDLVAKLEAYAGKDATVKFIENTGDKKNDAVEITVYEHYLVKEVDAAKDRIVFKGDDTYTATFTDYLEDDSFEIAFKDAEGDDIEIADFAEGDVVAVVAEKVVSPRPSDENTIITYYNLGESVVNGTVTGVVTETKIQIDDTEYDIIGDQVADAEGNVLNAEGAFYLTKSGKVFNFDGTLAKNVKVAYVLDAYFNDAGINSGKLQFQLLTADQGIVTVDTTSKFTYGKTAGEKNVVVADEGNAIANKYKKDGSLTAKADRLVAYKLNADNYLKEIIAFDDAKEVNDTFNKDLVSIDKKELDENAKIFVINSSSLTDSFVTTLSALNEENTYDGIVADDDEDVYSVAVFDAEDMSGIDKSQGIAVVSSKATTTYEEDAAVVVTVYSDNDPEAKKLYFTDDSETAEGLEDISAVNAGSVILYTADENGLVSNYIVLATYDVANAALTVDADAVDAADGETADGTEYAYVYGYINTLKDGKITLMGDDENIYKVRGNMYTFEYKSRGSKVTVEDYRAGKVDAYDAENETATFVFMKIADEKVVDVYTISNRATVE